LCSLEGWVHVSENILKEGRVIHMKPELVFEIYKSKKEKRKKLL